MGFELETQLLCLLTAKNSTRWVLPSDYTKHAFFQHSVEVYNDALTPSTAFAKTRVFPYLESVSKDSVAVADGVTVEGLEAGFNNNEFVVTLVRKQSVDPENFFTALLLHFLKALDKMEAVLGEYRVVPVTDPHFPYRSLLVAKTRDPRYSKVAFLAQAAPDAFAVQDLVFYYQCTVGFLLEDAIGVMTDLAKRYHDVRGTPDTILELVARARTIGGTSKLVSYLFLFLYSALTRHSRKVGTLFILRHAFQDLRVVLTPHELTRLDGWIRAHESPGEHAYFRSLHFEALPETQQQKFTKQALWDVGRLPFRKNEGRVFVEFRGFQSLLNHLVGNGPKSLRRVRAALKDSV